MVIGYSWIRRPRLNRLHTHDLKLLVRLSGLGRDTR